jgi:hypothetical protein
MGRWSLSGESRFEGMDLKGLLFTSTNSITFKGGERLRKFLFSPLYFDDNLNTNEIGGTK